MGFDENSAMVGTSASDKMGADSPDYANLGTGSLSPDAGAGLGQADGWAASGAQCDTASLGDNTSVGSISTSS